MKQELVTITKEEYQSLKEDSLLLRHLRAAGVDNWEGWDDAIEQFHEELEQED